MSIGERIRQSRKGKYTQEKLAEAIGVHVNTINKWETGKRAPDAAKLKALADALDTTVAYLTGETDVSGRMEDISVPSQVNLSVSAPGAGIATEAAPGLDYWGGVVENAEKAALQGKNLDLIVPMLKKACATLEDALIKSKKEPVEQVVGL